MQVRRIGVQSLSHLCVCCSSGEGHWGSALRKHTQRDMIGLSARTHPAQRTGALSIINFCWITNFGNCLFVCFCFVDISRRTKSNELPDNTQATPTGLRPPGVLTREPRQSGSAGLGLEGRPLCGPVLRVGSVPPAAGAPHQGGSAGLGQLLDELLFDVLRSYPRLLVSSEGRNGNRRVFIVGRQSSLSRQHKQRRHAGLHRSTCCWFYSISL